MSEAHNEHETPIKTPKQLIAVVAAGFLVPIAIIALLVVYVGNSARTGAGSGGMSAEAVTQRIAPVAHVEVRDANAPHVYQTGEQLFKAVCSACHATGAAGAPKVGNSADWAPRIAQGFPTLLKTALAGKGAMPPRGGTNPADVSDYEIARAIVYMANQSGGHFSEPPPPAQPASGAGAAPASAAAAPASAASAETNAAAAAISAISAAKPAATASAGQPAPGSPADLAAGKKLYGQVCVACHAAGVMGAPKFGNKADWAPRIKTGMDTLYNAALHGFNAMPAKGGSNAPDGEVKSAVDYMVHAAEQ